MIIPSIKYWVEQAEKDCCPLWQIVLREEMTDSELSQEEIYSRLSLTYAAMKKAAESGLSAHTRSISGMTGGDAAKYYNYIKAGRSMLSDLCSKAVAYALATSECNASMGVIVAAPTAGSAGIMPGAYIAAQEIFGFSDKDVCNALLTAAGVGAVISEKASLAGAVCGCQAECGSAAAMTAAGICQLMGGSVQQCIDAAALALKNCLGLACDPVAGLVEVPCVKRNGMYTVFAINAADMALAGVRSFIPFDEVIDSMRRIGMDMPPCIRETGEGGLATTDTGKAAREKIFGKK